MKKFASLKYWNEKNIPPCQHDICWKPWYKDLFSNPFVYYQKYHCIETLRESTDFVKTKPADITRSQEVSE